MFSKLFTLRGVVSTFLILASIITGMMAYDAGQKPCYKRLWFDQGNPKISIEYEWRKCQEIIDSTIGGVKRFGDDAVKMAVSVTSGLQDDLNRIKTKTIGLWSLTIILSIIGIYNLVQVLHKEV